MNRKDLKEFRSKELDIKSELQTLEEQKTRIIRITTNLDGMPKSHNNISYAMENYLDKKDKINQEILEQNNLYLIFCHSLTKIWWNNNTDIKYFS